MRSALLLALLCASPLTAQSREIAPFAGWMEGGAVSLGGENTDIDGAPVGFDFVSGSINKLSAASVLIWLP